MPRWSAGPCCGSVLLWSWRWWPRAASVHRPCGVPGRRPAGRSPSKGWAGRCRSPGTSAAYRRSRPTTRPISSARRGSWRRRTGSSRWTCDGTSAPAVWPSSWGRRASRPTRRSGRWGGARSPRRSFPRWHRTPGSISAPMPTGSTTTSPRPANRPTSPSNIHCWQLNCPSIASSRGRPSTPSSGSRRWPTTSRATSPTSSRGAA